MVQAASGQLVCPFVSAGVGVGAARVRPNVKQSDFGSAVFPEPPHRFQDVLVLDGLAVGLAPALGDPFRRPFLQAVHRILRICVNVGTLFGHGGDFHCFQEPLEFGPLICVEFFGSEAFGDGVDFFAVFEDGHTEGGLGRLAPVGGAGPVTINLKSRLFDQGTIKRDTGGLGFKII